MTSAVEADTREGSIVFTDLVGFTEYNDAAGDAAALAALDHQTELVAKVLVENPGRVVKELGDGLMLWFDTAPDGLRAAIQLLEVIDSHRRAGRFPLAIRIGVHHGQVVPRGDDIVGRTVNIAARVSDLAGPGELLVSDAVVSACGGCDPAVALHPVGPAIVKGVQQPIWLHRLVV